MKKWLCGTSAFDVKFDKNFHFWGPFLAKNINFGLDPHISDAKTDPFIPFGAYLFVYLNHISIQTRTVRGSDCSPAVVLSEQKDKLVTATGDTEKYSEKQANKVWLNSVYWFSRY